MLDYAAIKQLARQIGRPIKDLVALAAANDPFYAAVPHRHREGEWFAKIWHRFGFSDGVHLRRIHYVLVSQSKEGETILKPGDQPYKNTSSDWALLNRASLSARYLDLVPLEALVDRRNDEPMIFTPEVNVLAARIFVADTEPAVSYSIQDFPELPCYWLDGMESEQYYLIEVCIEKSTKNDWLVPLGQERGVNLVVGIGELSEIRSRHLAERVQETGKPARIIYISDFDPAGGAPREMFLTAGKEGSLLNAMLADAAVVISVALDLLRRFEEN